MFDKRKHFKVRLVHSMSVNWTLGNSSSLALNSEVFLDSLPLSTP